jgi:hypothetical protein
MKHRECANCGSKKFGLARYRLGTLQFCKRKCKAEWQAQDRDQFAALKRWVAYLSRHGP